MSVHFSVLRVGVNSVALTGLRSAAMGASGEKSTPLQVIECARYDDSQVSGILLAGVALGVGYPGDIYSGLVPERTNVINGQQLSITRIINSIFGAHDISFSSYRSRHGLFLAQPVTRCCYMWGISLGARRGEASRQLRAGNGRW